MPPPVMSTRHARNTREDATHRTQRARRSCGNAEVEHAILETGPGAYRLARELARGLTICRTTVMSCESETPRPSSRETATPPCWASDADEQNRHEPSVLNRSARSGSVLSGPRRTQAQEHLPRASARYH